MIIPSISCCICATEHRPFIKTMSNQKKLNMCSYDCYNLFMKYKSGYDKIFEEMSIRKPRRFSYPSTIYEMKRDT